MRYSYDHYGQIETRDHVSQQINNNNVHRLIKIENGKNQLMNFPNFILFKCLINYKTLPLHPMNNSFYLLPSKKVYKIISTRKKSLAVSEIRCWWLDSDTKPPSM